MRLYIKQKVFSFASKFRVTDAYESERYHVEGEVFTLGKKLHVYDNRDNEVAFIQQKLFSFRPRFFVFVNGVQQAEIVKEITFFKPRYVIQGKNWEVQGDIWSHDYEITENGSVIARIHKVWMSWGDSYELDMRDGADEVGLLAVILAIDAVMDQQAAAANSGSSS